MGIVAAFFYFMEVSAVITYTNSQVRNLIDEHLHSERDRAILKRRMIDGIRFEPLAEEFDMSVVQIRRICTKGRKVIGI